MTESQFTNTGARASARFNSSRLVGFWPALDTRMLKPRASHPTFTGCELDARRIFALAGFRESPEAQNTLPFRTLMRAEARAPGRGVHAASTHLLLHLLTTRKFKSRIAPAITL